MNNTLLLGLLGVSGIAVAVTQPSNCAEVVSSVQRLECYDASREVQDHNQGSAAVGPWLLTDSLDPITDETIVVGVNHASNVTSPVRQPYLAVRCIGGKPDTYIAWQEYIGDENHRVIMRFDEEEPVSRIWSPSNDRTASFYRGDTLGFMYDLWRAEQVAVRTTPYADNPLTLVFKLASGGDALVRIAKACGVDISAVPTLTDPEQSLHPRLNGVCDRYIMGRPSANKALFDQCRELREMCRVQRDQLGCWNDESWVRTQRLGVRLRKTDRK